MKRLVSAVLGIGIGVAIGVGVRDSCLHAQQVAGPPWISVQGVGGKEVMGFAAQTTPFKPGVSARVGDDRTVRAADGRTITGFAYYGWTSGGNVRVVVLGQVSAAQAKPTSFPGHPDSPGTRYEQVAEFTLGIGESRRVDELKAFGGEPTIVQVLTRR